MHFIPKQAISEVLYRADGRDGTQLIELDDEQQRELIELLGETMYRRTPKCRCIDEKHLILRYEDGTTAAVGEHWSRIERDGSGRSFSTRLFGGDALFRHFPDGALE